MKSKGVVKSEKDFVKGLEKGTKEIVKKAGGKQRKSIIASVIGPHTKFKDGFGQKKLSTYSPIGTGKVWRKLLKASNGLDMSKKQFKKENPLFKRHEAEEAKNVVRIKDKYGFAGAPGIESHVSPRVLQAEKKMLDYSTKTYGLGEKLRELRQITGEYELLKDKSIISRSCIKNLEKFGAESTKNCAT